MSKDLKKQLASLFSDSKESLAEAEPGQAKKETPLAKGKPQPPSQVSSAEVEGLQQAWRESQARLQALMDDLPLGYHEIDTEGRITRVNRTELGMLGYTAEEILGRPAWELVSDPETARQTIQARLNGQMPLQALECTYSRKDGSPVSVLLQDCYLLDANGKMVGIRTTVEDITARKRAEEQFREAEAKYRTLVEHIPAITYIDATDETSSAIYMSPQVETMLGYSPDEWVADSELWVKILHPDDRERVLAENARTNKTGENFLAEYRMVARDGRVAWVRDEAVMVRDMAGQPRYWQGVIFDLTERKWTEEALRRQNAELEILHETALGLLNRLDPDSLIQVILTKAAELAGTSHGYLYVVEPDEQNMVVRVGIGAFADWVGYRLQRGQGVAGQVWKTNAPLTVDDYQTWSGKQPGFEWLHAVVGIPLRSGSKVTGVISLGHLEPGKTFDQDAVALLGRFAELASLTLENAQLYALVQWELKERQRATAERERRITELATLNDIARELSSALSLDELYQVVYRQVGRVLDTTNFFIASYEEGSDEWTMAFQIESGQQGQVEKHKLGPGLTSYVIRTRQPLMLCNLEENRSFFDQQRIGRVGRQCKSWMGVPLNAAGRLVGVMVIQSYEQENLYDDQDLALFTTIASQAAVAVQNARLFEETRRRNEELAIINSISSALSRSLDLNQILEAALEPVLALTGFEAGLVSLVDPATGRLVLTVEHQLPEALANRLRDQGLEGTLCQLVYDRKETVCLTDLSQDPPIDTKGLVKLGLHSYLGIPLESKGQVVGTVCVFGHTARSVPDAAVSSMKAIGRQIGVAIDNAYLYEEVRVRAEEMAVLNEISQKLTAQLDVTDVLEEVYRSASRLLDATNFFVGLYDPNTDQVSFPFYVTYGQHNEDGTVIRSGQGKTGYVVRTRKPLLIKENVAQWRAEHGVEALDPQDALSWLGAPMIVGHRVLGVLAVENYTISRAFDEHDQDILVALANQAAIALQNAHLYEESQRRINELATLNDISREMASALSLENLYQVLYRQVGRVLNTTNFFIGSYEEGSDEWEIVFRMEQGQPGETGKCKMEAGLSRHIIRTRQPLLLHTVQENNAFFQEHNIERVGPQSKSWMGIPLIAAGQVVGVMAIQSYEQENAYSDQDIALFKTIGAQAAVAFQNARLFEEARTRVEEMATVNELSRVFSTRLDVDRVLKEVYRGASRLMDTTNFYIALYNPQIDEVSFPLYAEGDNIRPLTGRRRGGIGMTEYVIRTRAPLLIEENVQERLREIGIESIGTESYSWLGVPMIVGDQVIGVVAVQSYTTPRVYNEHHRDLLSAIAAQAAVAINNARLFQETHAHAEEMTALNDLSRGLSSRLSVSQVLDEVYRGVSRLLDTTNFYIGLYDPNRQEVSFPLNVTESVADREITTLPADQGITGYIIRTRESVLIRENINAWLDQQGMTPVGEPAQSWLGVPMSVGDQVLGVMAIQDYKTPNLYDEHDQEILITIANQTAIALQNARLFEQTQAARQQAESRVREMEILNRFTREVSSTLDLNHVLDALVNTLEQDMDFSHVSLDLIDEPANAVRTVRAAGLASGMNDLVRPLDQLQNDITIDVARKGQIEIIDGWDDRFDRELFERAGHAKLVRAFVPLLLRDRTVGVLEVGYQRGERAGILDEEISLLRSLADQVVMAVENARLFEQTRARARREQILRQVTEHIRSSSDPDTVMRTLVSELGTVLNRRTFVRLGSAEQLAQAPVPQESGGNPQGAVPGGQPEAEGGK